MFSCSFCYMWVTSQNWNGLKTAYKIPQYKIPYRNDQQFLGSIYSNRWSETVILIIMPSNKIFMYKPEQNFSDFPNLGKLILLLHWGILQSIKVNWWCYTQDKMFSIN